MCAAHPGILGFHFGPRLGARLSVAGGLETAFDRPAKVGGGGSQIFVENRRQWRAPPLPAEEDRRFHADQRATGVKPALAHVTYLLNLAATDAALRKCSIQGGCHR